MSTSIHSIIIDGTDYRSESPMYIVNPSANENTPRHYVTLPDGRLLISDTWIGAQVATR